MSRLLVLSMAWGCAEELEPAVAPDDLEASLRTFTPTPSVVSGCADLFVVGRNTADTAGIVFHLTDGLADAAMSTGAVQVASYTVSDPAVALLEVRAGQAATADLCTDVGGQGGPLTHTAVAVSGTVDVEVSPGVNPDTARATVAFTDLVLEDPATGAVHDLPFVELQDALVGWLPGR